MKVALVLAASMLAWFASGSDLVHAGIPLQTTQDGPALRILEPTEDTVLTGSITFRIGLTGGNLQQIVFSVDGVEACRAERPPFTCTWDAGSRLGPRVIRAVATLTDGRRVTAAVRTAGLRVFRSHADAVVVPVHVTDDRGRFVPGLRAENFRLLDEGVEQQLTLLDAGEGGAEVLLALDASGSMSPAMAELKAVVRDFLGWLRPVDRVTLAAFDSAFYILAGREADQATRLSAIDGLSPAGGTAIYDTMISSAETVGAQPGRRAVVVFTDGDDLSSRSTLDAAREALHSNDTLLYLIAMGKADSDTALRRRLSALALETGGAAYFSRRLSGATQHFRDIVDDLSRQYLLAFSPGRALGDGKWRKLTVESRDKSYRVRARSGYFAISRSK